MQPVIVATANSGKLTEISEILDGFPIELSSLKDHWKPVPNIEETGVTFYENARIKADWVYGKSGVWALADDSGLEVDALNGEPGVKSARFAGDICDDDANNRLLLQKMKDIPEHLRSARFRCVLVLKTGTGNYITAEGTCEGKIGVMPLGEGGFGYDPLFIPQEYKKSFAQLDGAEKNAVSHRGKALKKLREIISELLA